MHENIVKTQMFCQELLKRILTFYRTYSSAINVPVNTNEFPHFLKLMEWLKNFKTQLQVNKYIEKQISILKKISKLYQKIMF